MKMRNDYFVTSDFPLGITLITLGFPLKSISKSSSERMSFNFKTDKELYKAIDAFWGGTLRVEPKQFYLNHKLLKSRILANR